MSDVAAVKSSLLRAQWREYTRVTVEGAEGPVELVVRRPPDKVISELMKAVQGLRAAKAASQEQRSEADDGEGADSVLLWRARVVATCVFLPGAVLPLFTPDEAHEWPGLTEVFTECLAALNPTKALEIAKGN